MYIMYFKCGCLIICLLLKTEKTRSSKSVTHINIFICHTVPFSQRVTFSQITNTFSILLISNKNNQHSRRHAEGDLLSEINLFQKFNEGVQNICNLVIFARAYKDIHFLGFVRVLHIEIHHCH